MVERLAISCLFLIVVLFVSCSTNKEKKETFSYTIPIEATEDSVFVLEITNPHDTAITLEFDLGPYMLKDISDVAQHIADNSTDTSDLGKIKAAWRFVCDYTKSTENHYGSESWAQDDELILWSFGGGFCSKRATLLARLWQEMGYEARVWGLEGHVVPEVQLSGKWIMLDPTSNIYLNDKVNGILSVKEISELGKSEFVDLFYQSIESSQILFEQLSMLWQLDFYKSTNNNSVNDWYLNSDRSISEKFVLPKESTIRLTLANEVNTFNLIHFQSDLNQRASMPFAILNTWNCDSNLSSEKQEITFTPSQQCKSFHLTNSLLPISDQVKINSLYSLNINLSKEKATKEHQKTRETCYTTSQIRQKHNHFKGSYAFKNIKKYTNSLTNNSKEKVNAFRSNFRNTFNRDIEEVLQNSDQLFLAIIRAECGQGDFVIQEMKNHFE